MKLLLSFILCVYNLACSNILAQQSNVISKKQSDVIFNFIQNDPAFQNKIVIYPYLGTRNFRDFEDFIPELQAYGFKKDELLADDTSRYIFETGCNNPLIICFDTIAKYQTLSDSVYEAYEAGNGEFILHNSQILVNGTNIEAYSISGLIEGIYSKKMCEFNRPVISANGKYAIVDYFIKCGWLCGNGTILLLENQNNTWVRKKVLLGTQN